MTKMLVSKGKFLVLAAGLLGIAVYLGIALSWSEGLSITQFAESKSVEPAVATNEPVVEVEGNNEESDEDLLAEASFPSITTDVRAYESKSSKALQITALAGDNESESESGALVNKEDQSVTVASKPDNPLDDAIDPDVPGIAKLALTADFESLVDSGVGVSTAIRFIDERVDGGKYGYEVIRK